MTSTNAEEMYYYSKNKCEEAIYGRNVARQNEVNACNQKRQVNQELSGCKSDKINFEKRIESLEKIIKMLEGQSGIFSTNVVKSIEDANKYSKKADDSFIQCIKSDSQTSASISEAFKTKSVTNDTDSNNALILFKNEKDRLEHELENINRKMDNLELELNQINKNIQSFQIEQRDLSRSIMGYSYQMMDSKRYMF